MLSAFLLALTIVPTAQAIKCTGDLEETCDDPTALLENPPCPNLAECIPDPCSLKDPTLSNRERTDLSCITDYVDDLCPVLADCIPEPCNLPDPGFQSRERTDLSCITDRIPTCTVDCGTGGDELGPYVGISTSTFYCMSGGCQVVWTATAGSNLPVSAGHGQLEIDDLPAGNCSWTDIGFSFTNECPASYLDYMLCGQTRIAEAWATQTLPITQVAATGPAHFTLVCEEEAKFDADESVNELIGRILVHVP
jgi:hypothetical protein